MKKFKNLLIEEFKRNNENNLTVEACDTKPFVKIYNSDIKNVYQVPLFDATYPMVPDEVSNNFDYYMGKFINGDLPEIPVNETEDYWFETKSDDMKIAWDKDAALFSMIRTNYKMTKAISEAVLKYPAMSKEVLDLVKTLLIQKFEEVLQLKNTDEIVYSTNIFPDFVNPWKVIACINIGYPENDDVYGLEGSVLFLSIDILTLSVGLSSDFPWITDPIDIWSYNIGNIGNIGIQTSAMSAIQILMNDLFSELPVDPENRFDLFTGGNQNLSTDVDKINTFMKELEPAIQRNFPSSQPSNKTKSLNWACDIAKNGVTRIFIGSNIVIDLSIDYGVIIDIGIRPKSVKCSWDDMIYNTQAPDINKLGLSVHPTYDDMDYEPFYRTTNIEAKSILQDLGDICIEAFRKMDESYSEDII